MKVPIEVFDILHGFAKKNRISQVEWSKAARIPQPRISELVRISKAKNTGNNEAVKRSCTYDKVMRLYQGLRALAGRNVVSKYLLDKIEAEEDQNKKNILLVILLSDYPVEQQKLAGDHLYLLAKNLVRD